MNNGTVATIQYTPDSWDVIQSKCQWLVKSGMLPVGIDKPEKAAAIVLKGSELGIPAMEAFAQIHIIKGKPTCSAELQLGLLARGGVTYKFTENTDEKVTIVFYRPGFEPYESTFSMEDAKRAGLLSNGVWRQYPAAMLRARAISAGARVIGPDLIGGMSYTPEELGAVVDMETGEVIDAHAEVVDDDPVPPKHRAMDKRMEYKPEQPKEGPRWLLKPETKELVKFGDATPQQLFQKLVHMFRMREVTDEQRQELANIAQTNLPLIEETLEDFSGEMESVLELWKNLGLYGLMEEQEQVQ